MKFRNTIFLSCVMLLTACHGGNEKNIEEPKMVTSSYQEPQSTGSMDERVWSDTLTVAGKGYAFTIKRETMTSKPKVNVHSGLEYFDNEIHVQITNRADGSVFFEKNFTKDDFASVVPAGFMSRSLLLGIVFDYDKVNDHSKFFFAASVGDPEDPEMIIPILMTISTSGSIHIEKDPNIDHVPDQVTVDVVDPTEDQG